MIKTRLAFPALAAVAAAVLAGCGSGGSGSSSALAGLAPPDSLVFVEGKVRPTGSLKSNVDSIAQKVAGVEDLGQLVVEKLEQSAREDGEAVDFEKEVEPWLGEEAAVALKSFEHGDTSQPLVIVETTDEAAARNFVEGQAAQSKVPYKEGSYEGIDFEVGGKEGNAVGVVGEFLVIANDEAAFKEAVDASNGESLAGDSRFSETMDQASEGSLADAYVAVGRLLEKSDNKTSPVAAKIFEKLGIDLSEAAFVASVVPSADRVEIDVTGKASEWAPRGGDASGLLASLPPRSFAAFAGTGVGERLKDLVGAIDEEGIPGQLEPHQLKSAASQIGIDLGKLASSLEDEAAFAEGTDKASLGGAFLVTTNSKEAVEAIGTLGKLVRSAGAPGVTALGGKVSGFSIRSPKLGHEPLVVAATEKRVAIGYGLAQTLRAIEGSAGATLGDQPGYKEAASALGSTPISGYVSGPGALTLAEALVPRKETGFWEATRYLKHIGYVAIGSEGEGEWGTMKLIVGIEK
jgi:uncharacterized protein DUF3352